MDHHLEIVKTNIKYPIVFYNHQFNKSRPVSSHYHQDIEVVYVVSGKVEAYIDGKKEIFYQGEMFIINSHSVHQFNFPEFTHLYTYLLSVDVFKEFQIQSYFFKLKAPSNKEWFKPWLEMKYIHHLLPIEQHILMYKLYQKLIQDCLLDKKQEENKNICVNLILPLLWTAGILLNLVFIILGELNIKKNIKGKKYIDKNLKNLLEECKAKLHIKNNVEIMLQEFKKTPSIIGVFKPKILITQEFLDQDEKTKKYIIMHELSHYKRKDSLFNYVLLIITVIHWFNPFVWIFFKKIRQDIELATDEMVLEKLQKNEKKEYGMTLINSLQIFQEEPYTAKLLCVTDDNKNMERRIKMVKLSDKFSKNKILICVISLIVIVLGILLFFTQSNQYNSTKTNNEIIQKDETPKYEFRAFKPSFKSTSDSDYDDYDFTQDMTYMDKIYYKKINTYNEYEKEKAMWKDIIDMTESDFKDNFMVITAIENTPAT